MSVEVRPAQDADAPGLTRCISEAYAPFAHLGLPDVAAGVLEDIQTHQVWVADVGAEDGAEIAGGIIVARSGSQAHLNNIAVHPDQGGKGIGSALINCAVEFLQDQQVAVFSLATHVGMPQNLGLYRHLGWVETGREGDKVLMTRQI